MLRLSTLAAICYVSIVPLGCTAKKQTTANSQSSKGVEISVDPASCVRSPHPDICIKETLYNFSHRNKKIFDYKSARTYMFQNIDSYVDAKGKRVVSSIYTPDIYSVEGQGIPTGEVNTEHVWPQSFLKSLDRSEEAISDLYHIFPVNTIINNTRSNKPFAEIPGEPKEGDWLFESTSSEFEPPEESKGIIARAMFYISIEYRLSIDEPQESVLRKWSEQYAVSPWEKTRGQKIQDLQGNSNPFIIHPEWVKLVNNF